MIKSVLFLMLAPMAFAVSWSTWGFDQSNTHANTSETSLTWTSVTSAGHTWGKLCAYTAGGPVWAEPLFLDGQNIQGAHEVAIIATRNDTLEAFEANTCRQLWTVTLDTAWSNYPHSDNFLYAGENVGCISTPVVDTGAGVIYALCGSGGASSTGVWKLYARNVSDGSQFHAPATISGTVNSIAFNPSQQLGRPALALANGNIYLAFDSFDDIVPWQDWIFSYNATTLAQANVRCGACSAGSGFVNGCWMGGSKLAVDGSGNLFAMFGNGNGDQWTSGVNLTESMAKLSSTLSLVDWFTVSNHAALDTSDEDFDSSGPILPNSTQIFGGGKEGKVYLLSQSDMGHLQGGGGTAPQQAWVPLTQVSGDAGLRADVFGNNIGFFSAPFDSIYKCTFTTTFNTSCTATASTFQYPGAMMAYSSNGATAGTGILWATTVTLSAQFGTVAATLRAFKDSDMTEIWNSGTNGGDALGNVAKWAKPIIANGKVLAGSDTGVSVYGLFTRPSVVAGPKISVSGGVN